MADRAGADVLDTVIERARAGVPVPLIAHRVGREPVEVRVLLDAAPSVVAVLEDHHPTGVTVAACWCERSLVDVAVVEQRAGFTRSCGRDDCHPPPMPPDR